MFIELYSMLNIQPKDKAFKLAKGRLLSGFVAQTYL
ncbi:hypothetical protein HNO87_003033 [Acinetobacter schindleri]|nr:hypothetical protein [Acinetobacter schindleri]